MRSAGPTASAVAGMPSLAVLIAFLVHRLTSARERLLLHAAADWVFASLHTQPLENTVTRTLIRHQLALPGNPQMLLQFGSAVSAASTARRPPGEVTDSAGP